MDCFEIEGGVPLHGEVTSSGAKNAALPMMAAAILAHGKVKLSRVPRLRDIDTMMKILRRELRDQETGARKPQTPDAS